MPADLAELLDLDLAWRRVVSDLDERHSFARHPFATDLIGADLAPWLSRLRNAVATGAYAASPCRICSVPKPGGQVRPGADLVIADQVLYSALVQVLRSPIQDALAWRDGHPDYSYTLRRAQDGIKWFENVFRRWKAFDAHSIDLIDQGFTYVLTADIAGYYEQIDLFTLRSDLNGLGVNAHALEALTKALHRWARVPRRGLPQGYSPSDLLGKLYLNAVDLTLRNDGLTHKRWVDDFRVFCRSESEVRGALVLLSEALGRRGLVLQSAKTKIMPAEMAQRKFKEINELLQPLLEQLRERLADDEVVDSPYLPPWEIDQILEETESEEAVQLLRDAYSRYFITAAEPFRKTLFRFLLRRLGSAHDRMHLDHILSRLRDHPEETDAIAGYAARVGAIERFEATYLELISAGLLPYPYQLYQVFRWRLRQSAPLSDEMLGLARSHSLPGSSPWYVRATARSMLGKWGTPADLERLEHAYAECGSDEEAAEIVCCLERMELSRRNALLGRVAGDGEYQSRAVRAVRESRVRWDAA
jgi:hypothetical protein